MNLKNNKMKLKEVTPITEETLSVEEVVYIILFQETLILDIDELQKHGINVSDIHKLKNAGICTIKVIIN